MTTKPWSTDETPADIVWPAPLPSSLRRARLRTAAFFGLLHSALLVPIGAAQIRAIRRAAVFARFQTRNHPRTEGRSANRRPAPSGDLGRRHV